MPGTWYMFFYVVCKWTMYHFFLVDVFIKYTKQGGGGASWMKLNGHNLLNWRWEHYILYSRSMKRCFIDCNQCVFIEQLIVHLYMLNVFLLPSLCLYPTWLCWISIHYNSICSKKCMQFLSTLHNLDHSCQTLLYFIVNSNFWRPWRGNFHERIFFKLVTEWLAPHNSVQLESR